MINLKQTKASRFSKDISQVSSFKTRRIILLSKDQSIFSKTGEHDAYKNMLFNLMLMKVICDVGVD